MSSSPSISLIAAFCKELREAREYRQMTLNEVARATRISVEFLHALESARWDQIPRAYLRGYLGLYALAVGMNRDKVLRSFDQIVAPSAGSAGAVLEDAPPLLQAPEHVGVTRAKIRTAWFAALSQNRRTAYASTFLAILVLLGILNFTRRVRTEKIPLIPFTEALAESRSRIYSPLIILPLEEDSGIKSDPREKAKWIRIIGQDFGDISFQRDQNSRRLYRVSPFDTIDIQYLSYLNGRVHPAKCAVFRIDTLHVSPIRVLPGDTAIYELAAHEPLRVDTSQTPGDSLRTVD
jgi:hypothetical protein